MKKLFLVLFMVAFFVSMGVAQDYANDPAIGVWMSIDDDGKTPTAFWDLYLQNGKLFGKMIYAHGEDPDSLLDDVKKTPYPTHPYQGDLSQKHSLGTVLMWNMNYKAPGQWVAGRIIDPSNGNMYYVKVSLKGNEMLMIGSLDKAGILGRKQVWKKSTMKEALEAKAARK